MVEIVEIKVSDLLNRKDVCDKLKAARTRKEINDILMSLVEKEKRR